MGFNPFNSCVLSVIRDSGDWKKVDWKTWRRKHRQRRM